MIVMGIDYGRSSIGVAIGNTTAKTADPLQAVRIKKGTPNWDSFNQLIQEWQPEALVVGLPLNMDGSEQKLTRQVIDFCHQLAKRYKLPVHQMDERLTTQAAKEQLFDDGGYRALQDKSALDAQSAAIILEFWLNSA